MNTARARPETFRDDVDRLLIVGAIAMIWLIGEPIAVIPGLFAAFALWREQEWARIPLAVSGLLVAALVVVLGRRSEGGSIELIAAVIAGLGILVAVLAFRVRIGPRPVLPSQRPAIGPIAALPDPPASYRDLADDRPMLEFLDAVAHLDRETLRILAATWKTVRPADRDAAWAAAQHALEATDRTGLLEEVRSQVELWGRSAGGSPWTWTFGTMTDVDRGNMRRAAMPAILDASAAVLARDRLDARHIDVLAGPWDAALTAEPEAA
jgi:hypothetical protein